MVCPEEFADDPDVRIGATELIVADVLDHEPIRTERGIRGRRTELAGLPREHQCPFGHAGQEATRVDIQRVGSAVPLVLPGPEDLRICRVGEVEDVHEAADASKVLGGIERLPVRGEVAHMVETAARRVDAALEDRVAAV